MNAPDPRPSRAQPGPVYDNALRALAADELVELCTWIGIAATTDSVQVSEALPAFTQYADMVIRVEERRLDQVEFVLRATADLPMRMLEYRIRFLRRDPTARLTQHVIVLADGTVPGHPPPGPDPLSDSGSRCDPDDGCGNPGVPDPDLRVTYLRTVDPQVLLARPALATLACLGRHDSLQARTATLRQALEVIAAQAPPNRRAELAETALVLAGIRLDPDTIDTVRKEALMPISLEGTVAGTIIAQRAQAQGREEATVHLVERAIRVRFGITPAADRDHETGTLATELVRRHGDAAIDLVLAAGDLTELAEG